MDSYTLEEAERIQKCFLDKFGIETTLQKKRVCSLGIQRYKLYIGVEAYPKFYKLVYPTISEIPYMMNLRLPTPNPKYVK